VSRASPLARAIASQAGVELRLTLRRGENLLAMLGIPAALLLFLGGTPALPVPVSGMRVDRLLPGTLALAIVATGLVNLGIATAYERTYGVLKRLGGSPLGRLGLVVAKVVVLIIEIVLAIILVVLAVTVLGWRPRGDIAWLPLGAAVVLGTAAFAGLGLALAGTLRAEAVLVLANVLFLLLLGVGGVLLPTTELPGVLGSLAGVLPSAAMTDLIRSALEGGAANGFGSWAILSAWAVASVVAAARTFRWD
jgi:ABC-2 type transport system permease protein